MDFQTSRLMVEIEKPNNTAIFGDIRNLPKVAITSDEIVQMLADARRDREI